MRIRQGTGTGAKGPDGAVVETSFTSITTDLELGAIIAWLNRALPSTEALDWNRVRRLATVHQVIPLLQQAWQENRARVPPDVLAEFTRVRQGTALRGALALKQRAELLQILAEAGIPILLLKGSALGRAWYGDLSLRSFVDLDPLVPADRVEAARDALMSAGYVRMAADRTDSHDVPLYRPDSPCGIEIHHKIAALGNGRFLTYEALVDRAIAPEPENPDLRTLGPEDTLLHLCLHLLGHLQLTEGWALRYLYDMERHVRRFQIDWVLFQQLAKEAGAWEGCRAVLGLTTLVTGAPMKVNNTDAGSMLLAYGVPDHLDRSHHFLAAFLAAAAHGHLGQAWAMLLRSMVVRDAGGQGPGIGNLQPRRFVTTAGMLIRELVTDPIGIARQIRTWYGEGDTMVGRERLVADLFATDDM